MILEHPLGVLLDGLNILLHTFDLFVLATN